MARPFTQALAAALLALPACFAPTVPAPAVWPLRPDTLEANGWDRDCDLLHVSLDVTIDFEARHVYGTATSWVRALVDGTSSVRLNAVGVDVRGLRDSRGRELSFESRSPWITVQLAQPLARGEEEKLQVGFSARPEAGMYFFDHSKGSPGYAPQVWTLGQEEDNRYWFPVWDYPNDRATYDARIRVGQEMTAISNGELVEVTVHGGGERTFHWRMKHDMPTYLIAIAAGRWETYEDVWRGVPLHYHVPPGSGEDRARRALGETPAMMEYFSELLDYPYPYTKYDQAIVADFSWAGMENTTITMLHEEILGDEGEIADLDGDPRLLVAHELAHQWFGDLVTCLGWSHLWLNEAWASYLELLFERHQTDPGNYQLWLERYREWYLASGDAVRHPLALDWRIQGSAPERANHVYHKGPWVLHMLERQVGEKAFWQATRAYLKRHANGLVTTHDFARIFFDETGYNAEGFLEQWVFAGGHPVLTVSMDRREVPGEGSALGIRVRQEQGFDQLVPLFDFPVVIDLYFADGRVERHRRRIRDEEDLLLFELEGELVDVVFDADESLLCELSMRKPLSMWLHQAALFDQPASQWRALPHLREEAPRVNEAALALLRAMIESPQPLLRQRAARLCDFDDLRARRMLIRVATTDPTPRVRREAVHALLQHAARELFAPGSADYELFLTHMEQESSPAVRAEIRKLLELPEGE